MLPSLLKVVSHNLRHQVAELGIFEAGRLFLPSEKQVLAGMVVMKDLDNLMIKGMLGNLMEAFNLGWEVSPSNNSNYLPGKSADLLAGPKKESIGCFGLLHPEVLKKWDIKQEVYAFEVDVDKIISFHGQKTTYLQIPKYPKVDRDLAMFVPVGITSKAIVDLIRKAGGNLVEEVVLFDRYKDSQAYRISFRDPNKTLTDEEVNQKFEQIIQSLTSELGVKIRK
jgi:phenylalanyl-tRNA synthetase beta chain